MRIMYEFQLDLSIHSSLETLQITSTHLNFVKHILCEIDMSAQMAS